MIAFQSPISSWGSAAILSFRFTRHSKSFIIQSLYSLLLAQVDVCYLKPKAFQQMHWWTERKGIYWREMIYMRGREGPPQRKRAAGGRPSPRDSCQQCSQGRCKQTMKSLFYKGSLLKKHSFCAKWQNTQRAEFSPLLWGMEPSFGTFRAPGNMRLLWHTKLAVWGSLKDGILGTNLNGNPMNASSMGGGYAPFSNGSVDNRYQ